MKKKSEVDVSKLSSNDLLKAYSKCMTAGDAAKFLGTTRKKFMIRWNELGLPMPRCGGFKSSNIGSPGYHEVGLISDFHFGSFWQQKSALEQFCKMLKSRNINTLICAGDLTDGLMNWPTHETERFIHCADSYVEYLEDHYPEGFQNNFFILGNHDDSFSHTEGDTYDIGSELIKVRKDLTYHKSSSTNISEEFQIPDGCKITTYHGSGSCSNPILNQNREFRLHSKIMDMLSSGSSNSNVFVFGHCHKTCVTTWMGKVIIGLPCFQNDTPYGISRGSHNDIGGTILKYNMNEDDTIYRFSVEFVLIDKLGGVRNHDF